jgi:hypothetical protein
MVSDAGRMTAGAHQAVLDAVEYIACTLHARAYQELAAVGRMLRGAPSEVACNQTLHFLLRLLSADRAFARVYREVGIGDVLYDMVDAFAAVLLKDKAKDKDSADSLGAAVMTKEVAAVLFQVVARLVVGSELDRDEFVRRGLHAKTLALARAFTTQAPVLDLAMEVRSQWSAHASTHELISISCPLLCSSWSAGRRSGHTCWPGPCSSRLLPPAPCPPRTWPSARRSCCASPGHSPQGVSRGCAS